MKESDPPPDAKPAPAPFDAFQDLTRRLLAVPKEEIDKREAEYQREQAKKPKRGPKPKGG
jgi:hypothetical protein